MNILVVDDDPHIRDLVSVHLKQAGHQVKQLQMVRKV